MLIIMEAKILFFKVHLFILRETVHMQAGKGQRERIPTRFCTLSTEADTGLELTKGEIMT